MQITQTRDAQVNDKLLLCVRWPNLVSKMVKSLVSFLYTHGVNIMGLTATTWKASMVIP